MSLDKTSTLTIRIDPALKRAAKVKAAGQGLTLTTVIVNLLETWLKGGQENKTA